MNKLTLSTNAPGDTAALRARIAELEQALAVEQSQHARHVSLLSSINDAVIVVDTAFRVQEWNAAAERTYGWADAEARGKRLDALVQTRYLRADSSAEQARAKLEAEGVWRELVAQRHRDGRELLIEALVRPLYDSSGTVVAFLGVNRDMTEREHALAELRDSELVLRAFFDNSADAIVLLDRHYCVLACNPVAVEETQYIYHEPIRPGSDMRNFVVPGNVTQFERNYQRALGGETSCSERLVVYPSGEERWYQLSYMPVANHQRRVIAVALTAQNITTRKQLEIQLLQAQKFESIGRLAGGIAHDFNNLLTTISGAAELALTTLPPVHAARQDLDDIKETVQHAAALTRRLLALARQQVLAQRPVDLQEFLRELEPLLRRLLGKDVRLDLAFAPDLAPVMADATQLGQVVMNLAINARDAMPAGGTLRISASNVWSNVFNRGDAVQQPQWCVRMVVQDSGEGIAAEVLPHIFEPFFTTKASGAGTGLGLATCYGIITQHGGTIQAASSPESGTAFIIDLPAIT